MGRKKQRDPPPSFATAKGGHEHFTPMYDSLIDSPAFIGLSASAVRIYLLLRQQYKGAYTGNNIKYTYSQLENKGISRNTIPKALRMLVAFGFITYEQGGLEHQPNVYHFSDKWMLIKTSEDAKRVKEGIKEKEQDIEYRKKAFKEKYFNIV